MNRYNQFFLWFHELPKAHRIRLIFLTSLIFIITIGTFYWALKPNYAVLFQNLEPEDAQQIIKKLEEQNTPYQLQKNGQTIRVPKISVDRTRMEIMTTHLNLAGTVGYELFDKNSFGLTDFTQKINLQRALQGELERTINQLEEVHHARLHLAVAQQSAFSREQPRPKASLTLSLKRPLTPTQIQGIQQLIAASVPNLSISKVVILDQQGNVLSFTDPIEHQHHSFKQNFERELRNKVRHLLSGIFGRDSVRVQINAEFNYDVLEHEEIQPQALGKLVHLKESKNTVHAAKNKSPEKEEHHFEKNFQYGNERKLFKQAPGRLQRLTVSALIPEGTSPSMVRQIRGLIETAVGYDAKRGDSINIEALLHRKMSPAAPAVSLSKNNPKLQIPPLPALTIWVNTFSRIFNSDDAYTWLRRVCHCFF